MRAALLSLAALLAPVAARAAPSCKNLTATAITFAAYDVYATTAVTSSGTISYTCPPPTTPTVTIDYGLNPSGTQRRMLGPGGDLLSYDICQDAACAQPWGMTPVSLAAGNAVTVTYYGRVFALQDVSIGAYADTLTVTFNF